MNTEPVDYQFLLAILRPSPAERRLALGTVLILLALFVLTAPFRAIQLPSSPAFIAAFQTVLLVNDLITATLLFAQFSILRWRSLLVLASGYLFTALIAIPYALTFPGLFSPTGLLGATYQTAGWLYLFGTPACRWRPSVMHCWRRRIAGKNRSMDRREMQSG